VAFSEFRVVVVAFSHKGVCKQEEEALVAADLREKGSNHETNPHQQRHPRNRMHLARVHTESATKSRV
jgi:hypothetical protein